MKLRREMRFICESSLKMYVSRIPLGLVFYHAKVLNCDYRIARLAPFGKRETQFFRILPFSGWFWSVRQADLHKKGSLALLSRKDTVGNALMRSAKQAMPSGRNGQVRSLQLFGERLQKHFPPSYQKPSPAGEGFLCFLKGRMQCRVRRRGTRSRPSR